MGRLARSFLWAIAIGTSQLPLAFLTMAGDLDANTRPIIVVAQASPTPSKAKTSKAARVKGRNTYSSWQSAAPVKRPAASSEPTFGGKKFWKEQEDN